MSELDLANLVSTNCMQVDVLTVTNMVITNALPRLRMHQHQYAWVPWTVTSVVFVLCLASLLWLHGRIDYLERKAKQ